MQIIESSRLLRIAYGDKTSDTPGLEFVDVSRSENPQHPSLDFSSSEHYEMCTWHQFSKGASWTPAILEVNGRKGRRAVCVLASDKLHYRVYDLDGHTDADDPQDAATTREE